MAGSSLQGAGEPGVNHHHNNYYYHRDIDSSPLGEGIHQASQRLEELPGMGRQWQTKVIPTVSSGAEVL